MIDNSQIYKPTLFDFPDESSLFENLAVQIESRVIDTEADFGLVRLLIDPNNNLNKLYRKVSNSTLINWSALELFVTDEVFNKKNKFQNVQDSFGNEILDTFYSVNFFDVQDKADKEKISEAVEVYKDTIETLDGVYFDHAILTIQKDGSIAGLQPGKLSSSIVGAVQNNNNESASLTVESLLNSKEISVVLNYEDNASIVNELIDGKLSVREFPAKILFSHPNVSIYFYQIN